MAVTLSATPANLLNLMKGAQPGDVIELGEGAFPFVSLYGSTKAAPGVTLRPAAGAKPTCNGFWIQSSDGWTFDGLDITQHPTKGASLYLQSCKSIAVRNCTIHGATTGVFLTSASDILIEDNDIGFLGSGVSHNKCGNVTIQRNRIHDISLDGIRGGGAAGFTIHDNRFSHFYPPATEAHHDVIQFWTTGQTRPNTDLTITDNQFIRGDGPANMQGIFLRDEVGTLPAQRVVVKGNGFAGNDWHGISFYGVLSGEISDNFLLGFADALDAKGQLMTPAIRNENPPVGQTVVISGNVLPPVAKAGDYSALTAWLRRHDDPRDVKIEALTAQVAVSDVLIADLRAQLGAAQDELLKLRAWRAAVNTSVAGWAVL